MVKVSDKERADYSKRVMNFFQQLLTERCRPQAVLALKYEGMKTLETSGAILGQTAMQRLLNDPQVNRGFEAVGNYTDASKWDALAKEAGISPSDATPPAK